MTKGFKDLDSDKQVLNQNTVPISECETRKIHVYDCDLEVIDVPILTCEGLWRIFQREAEEIVAPGGVLIADPKERNRAINAAYARLWLDDPRFQWAGLAAFASKQVGCGLLHAADAIERIQDEYDAQQKLHILRTESDFFVGDNKPQHEQAIREHQEADARNAVPAVDWRSEGEPLSFVQQQLQHVYEMLALGNTTLFLDIYPLHMFYAKRGLEELKHCLKKRASIHGHPRFPVLWPVPQKQIVFGRAFDEILYGFSAIESGEIARSVEYLARHEQANILQSAIYGDSRFVSLVRANHVAYVTGFYSNAAQPIELTLASQCRSVDDGRTIEFNNNPLADLSRLDERMSFVLKAAALFDKLLHSESYSMIEKSIIEIAEGGGVR